MEVQPVKLSLIVTATETGLAGGKLVHWARPSL